MKVTPLETLRFLLSIHVIFIGIRSRRNVKPDVTGIPTGPNRIVSWLKECREELQHEHTETLKNIVDTLKSVPKTVEGLLNKVKVKFSPSQPDLESVENSKQPVIFRQPIQATPQSVPNPSTAIQKPVLVPSLGPKPGYPIRLQS